MANLKSVRCPQADREGRLILEVQRIAPGDLADPGQPVPTNHPFLSGRASRAAELGDLMRYVVEHTDVWTTSPGAIAEHVRSLGLPPRTITRP